MNNYGQFLYQSHHPTGISILHCGWYAGGLYHELEADQFVSKTTLGLHTKLLLRDICREPIGHTCLSCAKVCKNLTVYAYCCMYEPMDGLVNSKWG